MSWQALYQSDAQGLWAVIVVPALFLLWQTLGPPPHTGVEPAAARFVRVWALAFALETILDPLATGPLVRWLEVTDGPIGQAVLFTFVYLGDFRVFLLVLGVATPGRPPGRVAAEAAAWTFVVPVATLAVMTVLRALRGALPDPLPGIVLWLVYETAFTALALALRAWLVPARVGPERAAVRSYLRAVLAYVAVYYALWGAADALILLGLDLGWALRIVPNQLYYAFFVPFVALRYASTSASVQAAR